MGPIAFRYFLYSISLIGIFFFGSLDAEADVLDQFLDEMEAYCVEEEECEITSWCPSLDELICICISEMMTKNTYPPGSKNDEQFKEDAEGITDAVACRKKDWGRIGQVACDKKLCDEAKKGEAPANWPGNSKRNFKNCVEAAKKTLEKCKKEESGGGSQGGGSGGGSGSGGSSAGGGKLDCDYKHWYHQDDDKHQPPDGDDNPYNNDPPWCPKDKFDEPSTKKSSYPNYGEPDPVHLVRPKGVKGKDKPGPYDEGGGGKGSDGKPKDGACKDYKFPAK